MVVSIVVLARVVEVREVELTLSLDVVEVCNHVGVVSTQYNLYHVWLKYCLCTDISAY